MYGAGSEKLVTVAAEESETRRSRLDSRAICVNCVAIPDLESSALISSPAAPPARPVATTS